MSNDPVTLQTLRALIAMHKASYDDFADDALDVADRKCLYDEGRVGANACPDNKEYESKVDEPLEREDNIAAAIVHYIFNYCPKPGIPGFRAHVDVWGAYFTEKIYGHDLPERAQDGLPECERDAPGLTTNSRADVLIRYLGAADDV